MKVLQNLFQIYVSNFGTKGYVIFFWIDLDGSWRPEVLKTLKVKKLIIVLPMFFLTCVVIWEFLFCSDTRGTPAKSKSTRPFIWKAHMIGRVDFDLARGGDMSMLEIENVLKTYREVIDEMGKVSLSHLNRLS